MEIDTVVISLEEYNRLRDFKKKITDGMAERYNWYSGRVEYVSNAEVINELQVNVISLKKEKLQLSMRIGKINEETRKEIKNYGLWKLLKWWGKD